MSDKVTALRPAPHPHAPECAQGCVSTLGLFGPCQKQCANTPEFEEQSRRAAEANRLRFLTAIGVNKLQVVERKDTQ